MMMKKMKNLNQKREELTMMMMKDQRNDNYIYDNLNSSL